MLEIGKNSIVFEPDCGADASSSSGTRNFFDKSTSRICTIRNNGAISFTCKSFAQPEISTRTKDKGPATDIKISPNGRLASMQRNSTSVDVILMEKTDNTGAAVEFNVATKSRDTILLVEWLTNNQLLFVTSQCMEIMNIQEEKKTAKLHRSTNISATWAAPSNLIILAIGQNSSIIQPVVIHHGQFTRLKTFEIDLASNNTKDHILEKDVYIASIYGAIYVMVVRYNGRTSCSAELLMFELTSDVNTPPKLKYILAIGFSDGFGINILDNLVIVHHQPTSKTLLYDVALAPNRPSHSPLITTTIESHPSCQPPPALYTVYWNMFFPDIVADPVAGMMYRIRLKCDSADREIEDKHMLLSFLANRTNQETLITAVLTNSLKNRKLKLRQIRKIFAQIAQNLTALPILRPTDPTKSQLTPETYILLKLDQKTMLGGVFIPLKEDPAVDRAYLSNVMLHYLNSLNNAEIEVDPYFLELLVEILAEGGEMQKLQQLVTYRVIDETKQLAYMLVSYAARCPHIANAALDILFRQKANEEILEIMLEKGFIVEAARYIDSVPASETYMAKLIEATSRQDRKTAHAVHSMLAKRGSSEAARLLQYAKSWLYIPDNVITSKLYPASEIAEAEKEVAVCKMLD